MLWVFCFFMVAFTFSKIPENKALDAEFSGIQGSISFPYDNDTPIFFNRDSLKFNCDTLITYGEHVLKTIRLKKDALKQKFVRDSDRDLKNYIDLLTNDSKLILSMSDDNLSKIINKHYNIKLKIQHINMVIPHRYKNNEEDRSESEPEPVPVSELEPLPASLPDSLPETASLPGLEPALIPVDSDDDEPGNIKKGGSGKEDQEDQYEAFPSNEQLGDYLLKGDESVLEHFENSEVSVIGGFVVNIIENEIKIKKYLTLNKESRQKDLKKVDVTDIKRKHGKITYIEVSEVLKN